MLNACKNLDDYFEAYGELLGARASNALAPLHVPGRDPVHPGLAGMLRSPYEAQAELVTAIAKAWKRQKSIIISAQCGTGKSFIASAASHVHGHAGKVAYRALVMCPDHLLGEKGKGKEHGKWERELRKTLPGITVHPFDGWRDVLEFARRREKPTGPEWYLLGRDQSKFFPGWRTIGATGRQFAGEMDAIRRLRAKGNSIADLTGRVVRCPRCGQVVIDKEGNPVGAAEFAEQKKKQTCKGTVVRYPRECKEGEELKEVESPCGEPLWQFTARPLRWPPFRILHKMARPFDYLILDECHEIAGGDDVGQANAAGALIAASKKVVAMTGTLMGGYARQIFPLMMRLDAGSLVRMGFKWNGFDKFDQAYGRIQTTYHTKSGGEAKDKHNNAYTKGSSTRVSKATKPGIMPQLYRDHLVDKAVFLTLEQLAPDMVDMYEELIPVRMDEQQAPAYKEMEGWFRDTIKKMLAMGNKRLLGTMLATLLAYPDHPFGWSAISNHMEGHDADEYSPLNLDEGTIRPKEQALIDLVLREKEQGRQVWVYLVMTQVRDCGARLVKLLEDHGVRAINMKSSVDRRKREGWIYKHGKTADCVISHPKLVETGVDFFCDDRSHNFPTLAFYQTGYQLNVMRQAGGRSWRLGQWLPCKVCYLYYAGTLQDGAMELAGKKLAAAEALEGKFSTEGLAAMAGEDDATMALARALVDRCGEPAARVWSRSLGMEKQQPAPAAVAPPPTSKFALSAEEIAMFNKLYAQRCRA